jgi:hypothetical protein
MRAGRGHQREGSDDRNEAEKVSKPHDVAPGETSDELKYDRSMQRH